MAAPTQSIKSVQRFLGRLNIPEAKVKKIKSMNVLARTRTLIPSKADKKDRTDKDFHHNLLLELVRESGRKNYLIVFIRPKNDCDVKGDGKPYMMSSNMLGEDNWSTDEDMDDDGHDNYDDNNRHDEDDENTDEDADDKDANENAADQANNENPDQADNENPDQADNENPDEGDDQASEDLAYYTADENVDSDD